MKVMMKNNTGKYFFKEGDFNWKGRKRVKEINDLSCSKLYLL